MRRPHAHTFPRSSRTASTSRPWLRAANSHCPSIAPPCAPAISKGFFLLVWLDEPLFSALGLFFEGSYEAQLPLHRAHCRPHFQHGKWSPRGILSVYIEVGVAVSLIDDTPLRAPPCAALHLHKPRALLFPPPLPSIIAHRLASYVPPSSCIINTPFQLQLRGIAECSQQRRASSAVHSRSPQLPPALQPRVRRPPRVPPRQPALSQRDMPRGRRPHRSPQRVHDIRGQLAAHAFRSRHVHLPWSHWCCLQA